MRSATHRTEVGHSRDATSPGTSSNPEYAFYDESWACQARNHQRDSSRCSERRYSTYDCTNNDLHLTCLYHSNKSILQKIITIRIFTWTSSQIETTSSSKEGKCVLEIEKRTEWYWHLWSWRFSWRRGRRKFAQITPQSGSQTITITNESTKMQVQWRKLQSKGIISPKNRRKTVWLCRKQPRQRSAHDMRTISEWYARK